MICRVREAVGKTLNKPKLNQTNQFSLENVVSFLIRFYTILKLFSKVISNLLDEPFRESVLEYHPRQTGLDQTDPSDLHKLFLFCLETVQFGNNFSVMILFFCKVILILTRFISNLDLTMGEEIGVCSTIADVAEND